LAPQDRGFRGTSLETPQAGLTLEALGRAAFGEGTRWNTKLVVYLMLTQTPDGSVENAVVSATSGNALYDRLALRQFRGLGDALGPPPPGHLRSLWAFETDFLQIPPMPVAGCALDDFIPRHCFYPLQKNVKSKVTLEAIY
jgi:hypothetical protein